MILDKEGGILLVDKPYTWTSFDVVKKIRYTLKLKKVGHAGTLDPLATGLLLIGYGKGTKQLHDLQGLDKVYSGIIEIGKTTPTYDLESEFDSSSDISNINESQIEQVKAQFIGKLEQFPPAHSAVKINGKKAYELARKNEEVQLKSRAITIYELDFFKVELPEIHFRLRCSKGTYIRSFAHDFGKNLGVGAYLKSLKREKIGDFSLEKALSIDELINSVKNHES